MADYSEVHKGDTFKARGVFKSDKVATDPVAAGVTIEAFASTNSFSMPMQVTVTGGVGEFIVRCDTSTWPLGTVTWFLRYTDANGDRASSSFYRVGVLDGYV